MKCNPSYNEYVSFQQIKICFTYHLHYDVSVVIFRAFLRIINIKQVSSMAETFGNYWWVFVQSYINYSAAQRNAQRNMKINTQDTSVPLTGRISSFLSSLISLSFDMWFQSFVRLLANPNSNFRWVLSLRRYCGNAQLAWLQCQSNALHAETTDT